jgi:UDP-glucose 4-epimerase
MLVADAAKAAHHLGWSPPLSSLETIVKTAYAWQTRESAVAALNR